MSIFAGLRIKKRWMWNIDGYFRYEESKRYAWKSIAPVLSILDVGMTLDRNENMILEESQ